MFKLRIGVPEMERLAVTFKSGIIVKMSSASSHRPTLTERGSPVELPLRLVVQLVAADHVPAEDDERRDDDEERDGGAQQDHFGRVEPLEPAPPQRVHAQRTQLTEAGVDVVPRRRVAVARVGYGRPEGPVGGRLP